MDTMFQRQNPEFALGCERLAQRALEVDRETLISFEELHTITKLSRVQLYQAVRRVNRDLLQAKRLLVNRRGQGYVVAGTDLHMSHAHQRKLKAARQHSRGFVELRGLDTTSLSPAQQKQYQQQLAVLGTLSELSRKHTLKGIELAAKSLYYQREALHVQEDLQAQLQVMRQGLNPS